jgi:hypothetical protein
MRQSGRLKASVRSISFSENAQETKGGGEEAGYNNEEKHRGNERGRSGKQWGIGDTEGDKT